MSAQYEYYVQAIPPTITGETTAGPAEHAAKYLQNLINQRAEKGWEFYRVEQLAVKTPPGCVGKFLGHSEELTEHYLVVFRKPQSENAGADTA